MFDTAITFVIIIIAGPGITGLWQVNGRSDVSYRRRVAFDTVYARKFGCIGLDIKVIAMTIPAVLLGRGVR